MFPASCHYPVSRLWFPYHKLHIKVPSLLAYMILLAIPLLSFTCLITKPALCPDSQHSFRGRKRDLFGFCIFSFPLHMMDTNKVNIDCTFKCLTFVNASSIFSNVKHWAFFFFFYFVVFPNLNRWIHLSLFFKTLIVLHLWFTAVKNVVKSDLITL